MSSLWQGFNRTYFIVGWVGEGGKAYGGFFNTFCVFLVNFRGTLPNQGGGAALIFIRYDDK